MISSVPIHHNSFTNELMWRTHFPVKQESPDDSTSNISPEIYADTDIDTDQELDQHKARSEHLARFIPPTISTSPTMPAHQGIYLSPTYQQRDLTHFRASPNRVSPYARSSPHHKTSPTFHSPNSILSSPSPSGFYQKISPSCDPYVASTPDKSRVSHDLYRTSPADFHRISPTSHISASSSFGSDPFQSPQSYSHLPPHEIYRSLNFNAVPKTNNDIHSVSSRSKMDEPLNLNSMQGDLTVSQTNHSLFPQSSVHQKSSPRASPTCNDSRLSPRQVSSENIPLSPRSVSNHESHDSVDDSRSPSPVKNLMKSSESSEVTPTIDRSNDVPSLKCYFCSYNTKSRIQLNKHMRDAHTESKIIPNQYNKESNDNESEDDNENETHSNLSEDFMMDEYDDDDGESEEYAVNVNKVSHNANSNRRTSYKCKKCVLTFNNKDEYYVHQKDNHIKREKLLECKLCPFVTEYKHHHEYHIKNHFKMKPFKCSYSNCKYSCNNQSMLNSHVKSHKSFYQFHCKNCNYATKYMHSFKLHLRKNNHEKGITLNEDGSVNNDIIIDIHGTRRGPKRKSRKLDDNALQNINNNNCITQTIKKTIHHEPETEYNNNVTLSSNNGSSRSNSPLTNVNYNNNNNENYYLNTKLFVYSHMASMMNEKTPEIWVKDTNTLVDSFKQFGKVNEAIVPEVVDLSESAEEPTDMHIDAEAPLDLSKSFEVKPQPAIMDLIKTVNAFTNKETCNSSDIDKSTLQTNGNQKSNSADISQALIKIENKVKTSADMIRIVGKNNYNIAQGNVYKNKNKIKLCKNSEKSVKNAIERKLKANELKNEIKISHINNNKVIELAKTETNQVPVSIETPLMKINQNQIENVETNEGKCDIKVNNKMEEPINEISNNDDVALGEPKSSPESQIAESVSLSEANKQAISTNKNRRRKGKAYKLQITNDYLADENEDSVNEDLKNEEPIPKTVMETPKTLGEDILKNQSKLPSSYEIQMDYLKQIQNQYLKTFQNNKCLENCAPVLPPMSQNNTILTNINNNINSSPLFDAQSQILSNYPQLGGHDFMGSHLKSLERINSHLLQNSVNMQSRHKAGLKSMDNFLAKKADAPFNPFLNRSNEALNKRLWYKCELCDIQYLDELIYSIHMRYHNVEHPYKCNLCGLQTGNKLQFNLHIIQTPH